MADSVKQREKEDDDNYFSSSEKMDDDEENYKPDNSRGHWSKKLDYYLSLLGYCVGLGNLWRFPYICMRNGGGAFLIPFVFFLLACGLPLYFLEVSLGQFTGKGAVHAWEICPLFKGIGFGMMVVLTVINTYYNIIIAWTLYFFGNSFINPLPWSTCDNKWNTPSCIEEREQRHMLNSYGNNTFNTTIVKNATYAWNETNGYHNGSVIPGMTAEEEFWQFKVLHLSEGLHEIGGIPWHLPVCFFAAWIVIYLCLIRGIKSLGKVVYITALLPYVLLFIILIRGLTLPGSHDGIIYYLRPDFGKLFRIQTWVEAGLQVFYSLGPAWGPLITMSSYNKFDNNCYRDSIILTLVSEGTSIFGGLVVFSVLGFMAHEANLPVSDVVKSGPGLGFIAYPEAIAQLPLSNLWAVLFFCMLFVVGLDSQFASVEVCCTALTDSYPALRKRRALMTGILCAIYFLLGLSMCTEGGVYIFQLLDWYIASLAVPLFALLECIIFGWIYGAEMYSRDIELMLGRSVPTYMRVFWCFITPFLMAGIFVFTLATYTPPTYGKYVYPSYARVIGWIIACLPLIPLIAFAFIAVKKAEAPTLKERLKKCLKPTKKWVPVLPEERVMYPEYDREYRCGVLDRISMNIFGSKSVRSRSSSVSMEKK